MNATADRPTRGRKAKAEVKPAEQPASQLTPEEIKHQEVVELIRGRCMEMGFTVHGLPKSRRVNGVMGDQIASAVKGTKKGVRASWSLFTSAHPAVKELNQSIRDLEALRESWTIVKSADVQRSEEGRATIESGKRLIWDHDVDEFYKLFVNKAKIIDIAAAKVDHALNHITKDEDQEDILSIKSMDRAEAGDTWEEAAYPSSVTNMVGVGKERDGDGVPILDETGTPKYIIEFREYHVSEKLPDLLRERAIERVDAGISSSIETAMGYWVGKLSEDLNTFMAELVNRTRIYPVDGHPFRKYCALDPAEVIKVSDRDKDSSLGPNEVKVLLSYKELDPADASGKATRTVRQVVGPISKTDYFDKVRPQATEERKKIYPSVIEDIIAKMQAFRDRQARMLGPYGAELVGDFDELLRTMLSAKRVSDTNLESAERLAGELRRHPDARESLARRISDTIAVLGDRVESVKKVAGRRSIKAGLIGQV